MLSIKSKTILLVLFATLGTATHANAYLIGLEDGDPDERNALAGTLTTMGHTVTTTIDGSLDLIISAPGNGTADFPGIPYLQISDHGEDHLTNDFQSLPEDTVVTVTLTGAHPILAGLDPSWNTLGFWHYDPGTDYVGWVTGVPGLADVEANAVNYPNALAVSGADIYIGWNVYGPDATDNDLLLLQNSIEFLVTNSVSHARPVPALGLPALILLMLMMVGGGVAIHRRRLPNS